MWNNTEKEKPEIGIEVLGYNPVWIDEDFNPDGTRICFLSDEGYWTMAVWCNTMDSWYTVHTKEAYSEDNPPMRSRIEYVDPIQEAPTMWTYKPTIV